jgi:hypothetical protein
VRRVLTLLPGLRWTGKLVVLGAHADGWLVDFDAEDPSASADYRHVLDRAVLSTKQVRDWTGVDLDALPSGSVRCVACEQDRPRSECRNVTCHDGVARWLCSACESP